MTIKHHSVIGPQEQEERVGSITHFHTLEVYLWGVGVDEWEARDRDTDETIALVVYSSVHSTYKVYKPNGAETGFSGVTKFSAMRKFMRGSGFDVEGLDVSPLPRRKHERGQTLLANLKARR